MKENNFDVTRPLSICSGGRGAGTLVFDRTVDGTLQTYLRVSLKGLLGDVERGRVGVGERHTGHPNPRCPRLVDETVTPAARGKALFTPDEFTGNRHCK